MRSKALEKVSVVARVRVQTSLFVRVLGGQSPRTDQAGLTHFEGLSISLGLVSFFFDPCGTRP